MPNQSFQNQSILPVRPIKIPYFISDKPGKYRARRTLSEAQIIKAAKALIAQRIAKGSPSMTSPEVTRDFLILHLSKYEHEIFMCVFLDNQHRLISLEEMFSGTIDTAAIYPREVVKRALALNAAAVIFAHNHPSGLAKPSQADRQITDTLKNALSIVEIRTLDHFIIAGAEFYSFSEHGLI